MYKTKNLLLQTIKRIGSAFSPPLMECYYQLYHLLSEVAYRHFPDTVLPVFQFVLFTEYFLNPQGIAIKAVLTKMVSPNTFEGYSQTAGLPLLRQD